MRTILVTGGAGFIGSWVIRHLLAAGDVFVVNVDKLTYAANRESAELPGSPMYYHFEHADICDLGRMEGLFQRYAPDAIMHLAAESHVDRSIDDAGAFIQTNIVGTYTLLQAAEAARQPAITVMRIIFFIVVSECLVQTVETIQTAKQFIKFIKFIKS